MKEWQKWEKPTLLPFKSTFQTFRCSGNIACWFFCLKQLKKAKRQKWPLDFCVRFAQQTFQTWQSLSDFDGNQTLRPSFPGAFILPGSHTLTQPGETHCQVFSGASVLAAIGAVASAWANCSETTPDSFLIDQFNGKLFLWFYFAPFGFQVRAGQPAGWSARKLGFLKIICCLIPSSNVWTVQTIELRAYLPNKISLTRSINAILCL